MTKKELIERFGLKDVPHMTANDKAKVLMDWDKFLNNGCKFVDFTDKLYKQGLAIASAFPIPKAAMNITKNNATTRTANQGTTDST